MNADENIIKIRKKKFKLYFFYYFRKKTSFNKIKSTVFNDDAFR